MTHVLINFEIEYMINVNIQYIFNNIFKTQEHNKNISIHKDKKKKRNEGLSNVK